MANSEIKEKRIAYYKEIAFVPSSLMLGAQYWAYNIATDSFHVATVTGKRVSDVDASIRFVDDGVLTDVINTIEVKNQED